MTIPPPFNVRFAKLRIEMKRMGVSVFVCDHGEMLAWLTGYTVSETRYRACIVPAKGEPMWVLRAIDHAPCTRASWIKEVRSFSDDLDPFVCVAEVITEVASDTLIGADFNSYGFTAHALERLRNALPGYQWCDLNGISDRLRAIKDEGELALLRQAAEIGDGAMAALVHNLRPGMRPRDAAAIASTFYLQNGADDWWVGPIACSKHAQKSTADIDFLHPSGFTDLPLISGDILHAELVPRVAGYSARMMRSISIGPANAVSHALIDRLITLQDMQFDQMKPGACAHDVDAILRRAVLAEGLRATYPNATGYQIGLYSKTPRSSDFSLCFHPGADWHLEEGMTFHMYLSAQGHSISESVVIGKRSAERLTKSKRGICETSII